METHDINAQRNFPKSILVGGILCLAVVSSTKSNNGMHWYELSLIHVNMENKAYKSIESQFIYILLL